MSSTINVDRVIARHRPDDRRKILDQLARHRPVVAVEHSYTRDLSNARQLVGTVLGVGWHPGGDVLVLEPLDGTRIWVLPAAHIVRVRWASSSARDGQGNPVLGEVVAGPPLTAADR